MAIDMGLIASLKTVVGRQHVLTNAGSTRPFSTGYRFGGGAVSAVVRPGSLVELWRVLKLCVATDLVIVMQSANTGLTGGSTPNGVYDRSVVIVNTLRISGIHLLRGGEQVVCLPGATLDRLEGVLAPLEREPHSVIGSSCIGASVFGGICNNSGGALVRRGPAYTELALYARIDEEGRLTLINRLGIDLGVEPEEMLVRLEKGAFKGSDVADDPGGDASDKLYAEHVRRIDEASPARFNADRRRLFEASGSAGKIALFAVRLDTFAKEETTTTFYVGTNRTADLTAIRRHMLAAFERLPITAEYIHRAAFDMAARYGKDLVIAIERLGTARLPRLFAMKNRVDAVARRLKLLPEHPSDRIMQRLGSLWGEHLPWRLRQFRDRFEHHLILKVAGEDAERTRSSLSHFLAAGDFFECSPQEAEKAYLHRFAVASAAVRYRAVHGGEVAGIVSLDVALRRNDADWFEQLPADMEEAVVGKLYYGHFFCHVFHQDYIVRKGFDLEDIEHRLLAMLDARGAEYPAEHNVGHLYPAKPALAEFYRQLDPTNMFNPGIGHTSRCRDWV